MFMTNQSYKLQKQSPALPRLRPARSDEGQNEQQQKQPANHSPDNAETAHCLTPFSHPG